MLQISAEVILVSSASHCFLFSFLISYPAKMTKVQNLKVSFLKHMALACGSNRHRMFLENSIFLMQDEMSH